MSSQGGDMDPMDFTMDEGQQPQQPNPSQCHYPQTQPHQPSSSNNFLTPHPHSAHHYDPVHNTDTWYSQAARPPFTVPHAPHAPQNVPQYVPGQLLPAAHWQGFAADGRRGMLGENSYRQQAQLGYMSGQYNNSDLHRFAEPSPFGHNQSLLPSGNMPAAVDLGSVGNTMALVPTSTAPPVQTAQTMNARRYFDPPPERHRHAITVSASTPMNAPPEGSRHIDLSGRSAAENRRNAPHAHIAGFSRPHEQAHSSAQDVAYHRRRLAHFSDSDDDEDLAADTNHAPNRARRAYVPGTAEREEDILIAAAMRGQLATGKKVPSKEAIASLEKLVTKDLDDSDKSCIICYNDFGVPNPEGLIEHPIRLPKCKHIFGDSCIKKWFEDSDTCPYCRDRLPSERTLPKSFSSREAYQRYRERAAGLLASQAAAYQQSRRSMTERGTYARFPSSAELMNAAYNQYGRPQEQENYQYPMRSDTEQWTSGRAAQRDSPERRRQQARGRTSLGRPTSVGSARYYNQPSGYQTDFMRATFHGANVHANGVVSMAYRPTSPPGFTRQNSDRTNDSTTSHHSSALQRLSGERLGRSSPEASPAVAVGSGVLPANRSASSSQVRVSGFPNHQWLDHDHNRAAALSQSNTNTPFPPERPNDLRALAFGYRAGISQNNENPQAPPSFADPIPPPPGLLRNQTNLNRR